MDINRLIMCDIFLLNIMNSNENLLVCHFRIGCHLQAQPLDNYLLVFQVIAELNPLRMPKHAIKCSFKIAIQALDGFIFIKSKKHQTNMVKVPRQRKKTWFFQTIKPKFELNFAILLQNVSIFVVTIFHDGIFAHFQISRDLNIMCLCKCACICSTWANNSGKKIEKLFIAWLFYWYFQRRLRRLCNKRTCTHAQSISSMCLLFKVVFVWNGNLFTGMLLSMEIEGSFLVFFFLSTEPV